MKKLLSERLREAVRFIVQQANQRASAEEHAHGDLRDRTAAAREEFRQTESSLQAELSAAEAAAMAAYQEAKQALARRFETEHDALFKDYSAKRLKVNSAFDEASEELTSQFDESKWTIETVFEADKRLAKDELVRVQRQVGTAIQRMDSQHEDIAALITHWELDALTEGVQIKAAADRYPDALAALQECVATEEECLNRLQRFSAPRLLRGHRLVILFAVVWLALQLPALWMDEWVIWLAASAAAVASIGVVVRLLLTHSLRVSVRQVFHVAAEAKVNADLLQKRCLDEAASRYQDQNLQAKTKRENALLKANLAHDEALQERTRQQKHELELLSARYEPRLDKLRHERDATFKKDEAAYQQAMAAALTRFEGEMDRATGRRDQLLAACQKDFERNWQRLRDTWCQATATFARAATSVREKGSSYFPAWAQMLDKGWSTPTAVPPAMRLGDLQVNLETIPDGVPENEELRAAVPPPMTVPALLGFPERGSLLIKAEDEGRARAIELLQAVMLRCLTAIPPGKVRFTIVDPVGLGENFAAFAHLADYDEKLVTSRIWTESAHIEQRLADLTEHIENVIQKYLRNQFQTLEDYNAQAGEIAEPYRILVVAHFPVNFTDESARRLLSIAASGAKCGLHTFLLVDTKQPLPRGFDLKDLEQNSSVMVWKDGAFHWLDPDFGRFPLSLDVPPSPERCTALLQQVGERARQAGRVEVPFHQVAPAANEWWTGDSRRGLRVALGKAGATRKQYLELGEGTSQHVLIAGKTGSGKSTLLHALIVQLALSYSPDEVELYLVDFKKGVEFKTYASHRLPHARVVAIESEREFGLSVLQRLDQELKARGDKFRARGAHDLPSYRAAVTETMPRVLLIVDEFQEFFVEDDRVAQESALLLDRLVRQGRAFGIHILLGSQTLGGAYSLARSTIDQMAIRIALQCSEADGHLILSKENSAARLLSRPGEAIYNNANGLLEGNNLFQTVWLSEQVREECLGRLQRLAAKRKSASRSLIVFEGNAPAHLEQNRLLNALFSPLPSEGEALGVRGAPVNCAGYPAWLGDAIAIKEPTEALFRRQSGSNLLLIGQHPEAALSILTAAVVSLGLHPGADARFHLLTQAGGDSRSEQIFGQLAEVLGNRAEQITWRNLPASINTLAAEVERRLADRTAEPLPQFLVVHGLQQFRDLRRQEDDFGLPRRDDKKPVPPSRAFVTILREGPTVGVFTLAWCDTLSNLQRTFDRPTLREFEMRVLFQMNANDSSTLIDSPIASRLGLYRALFYSEDQGLSEKFRPYGLPAPEWLAGLKPRLTQRAIATSAGLPGG